MSLELKGVSKHYGGVEVLADVDLVLGDDEMLVVLGATGAGKTTLLRLVAGLIPPDRGEIFMNGKPMTTLSPAERDVGFVFQNFSLYPGWSVRRNLEFPLRAPGRHMQKVEREERVEWAASLLHIENLLERDASRLSGGEMQRVAIGRAIVRRPRLFLFDEPLTNLDAKLREELRAELSALRRQLGIPTLYVTHDQAEALSMGDRVAVISNGRVLQEGTGEEIYARPVTPLVARQLGQPRMNILPVVKRDLRWVTENGNPVLAVGAGQIVDGTPEATSMTLGIRPEDVDVTGGERAASVILVEDTGPGLVLVVDWAGLLYHIATDKSKPFRPGERVFPRIRADRAVFWRAT